MERTRKIKDNKRLLIFSNLDEEEILVIKLEEAECCSICNGHSKQYWLLPHKDGYTTYCNLCFQWYRKDIKWRTEWYTPTFDNIILYVIKHRSLFDEEDLDMIDEYFDMKTNKKIRIRNYIDKYKGG